MPFTAEDLHFLTQVLSRISGNTVAVEKLVQDESSLDLLLDNPAVLEAVMDEAGCLRVSPRFYFYVLIRDILKRGKVHTPSLCHYLSEVLESFTKMTNLCHSGAEGSSSYAYLSDLLIALQKLPPNQSYQLRVHLGNYSLFMSGLFLDRLEFHSKRTGAPGIRFYESVGSASYRIAAENRIARQDQVDRLLQELSQGFHELRLALNEIADRRLHFHGNLNTYALDTHPGNPTTP